MHSPWLALLHLTLLTLLYFPLYRYKCSHLENELSNRTFSVLVQLAAYLLATQPRAY